MTVVVPSYNGRAFVADAIGSIRSADRGDAVDILLVDDASEDDTPMFVADTFPDIRVHRIARNVGEAVARNTGLARATTDFVTFLDQDDVVLPDHFTTMLRGMDAGYEAVAPASVSFSATERLDMLVLASDQFSGRETAPNPCQPFRSIAESEAAEGGISNTVFASREALISAGGFTPFTRGTGDYMLLWNLSRTCRLAKATVPTLGYRLHPEMSTFRYNMAPNILSCRVGLRVAGATPGASAWDVQMVAGAGAAGGVRPGSIADAIAFGRLVGLHGRQWFGVMKRIVKAGSAERAPIGSKQRNR